MKKRVRMFAGPNGSGKSTVKATISADAPNLFTTYINPDDIEKDIRERGFLNFQSYGIKVSETEVLDFFENSSFLKQVHLAKEVPALRCNANKLMFDEVEINAYFASVAADFIRQQLLAVGKSFTFETVMSSSDKVEFLRRAQQNDFRTYLYYVATKDPAINIARVRYRVQMGGHPVPEDKILSRYKRSLDLLIHAIRSSNRAYIFDNSNEQPILLAEITDGKSLNLQSSYIPLWFQQAVLNKLEYAP